MLFWPRIICLKGNGKVVPFVPFVRKKNLPNVTICMKHYGLYIFGMTVRPNSLDQFWQACSRYNLLDSPNCTEISYWVTANIILVLQFKQDGSKRSKEKEPLPTTTSADSFMSGSRLIRLCGVCWKYTSTPELMCPLVHIFVKSCLF